MLPALLLLVGRDSYFVVNWTKCLFVNYSLADISRRYTINYNHNVATTRSKSSGCRQKLYNFKNRKVGTEDTKFSYPLKSTEILKL